jgi:hypothetical protein
MKPAFTPERQQAYVRERSEVRGRAAEMLAAIGTDKLRTVVLFRACRWAEVSMAQYEDNTQLAYLAWIRAAEWLRIWLTLPLRTNEAIST